MTLQERDKKHLWHPLKQHQLNPDSLAIVKAKGCVLTDENGQEYIDAIASWYTCMYGHCNDYIIEKTYAQMQQLDQIMFSDFTHEPAIKLSEALIEILPDNQDKIFFNDNGSTAVEAAIKMTLQYFYNKGEKRTTFIAFENGFHGDTFGAMSVSGLSVYNGPFEDFLIDVKRIPTPNGSAAGMKVHDADGLNTILKFCKSQHILTIADEVMTGFGKTGKYFASDFIETKPDIMCLSKALTAGLLPMAITSCSQTIYNAFLSDQMSTGFFHCHTYSANPIACAAAIAGIELLKSDDIQTNIKRIIQSHKQFNTYTIAFKSENNTSIRCCLCIRFRNPIATLW